MSAERDLILRLLAVATELHAPDPGCRALRSIYSRRGVCTTLPAGTHHPLCDAWNAAICDARDWLDAPRQLDLLEAGG